MKTIDLAVAELLLKSQGHDQIAPDKPAVGPKRYSLDEMLVACDLNAPMPADVAIWDKAPIVGAELL